MDESIWPSTSPNAAFAVVLSFILSVKYRGLNDACPDFGAHPSTVAETSECPAAGVRIPLPGSGPKAMSCTLAPLEVVSFLPTPVVLVGATDRVLPDRSVLTAASARAAALSSAFNLAAMTATEAVLPSF